MARGKKPASPGAAPKPSQPAVSDAVAVDCEMVQLASGKLALAHVVAVDWDECVLINVHVDPGAPVADYLTRYSGLRAGDLDGAASFESVQARVAALLDGRVLVGHSVCNDLKYLQLKHPTEMTRDTAELDWGPREKSLSFLSREVLGLAIQSGTHSPEEDAVASLRLLKHHQLHGAPPLRTVDLTLTYRAPTPRPAEVPCAVLPPADADAADAAATKAAVASEWTLRLPWGREGRDGLLRWFKAARAEPGGPQALVFPATLSKQAALASRVSEPRRRRRPRASTSAADARPTGLQEGVSAQARFARGSSARDRPRCGGASFRGFPRQERGSVHREAQALRLPTASAGVEDERFISVLAEEAAAAAAPPPRAQHLALIIYRWAEEEAMQAACDAAADGRPAAPRTLSRGEVLELLGAGRELPSQYAALQRRAERLLDAAGSTVPALETGIGAAERTRRDWERLDRLPCRT